MLKMIDIEIRSPYLSSIYEVDITLMSRHKVNQFILKISVHQNSQYVSPASSR